MSSIFKGSKGQLKKQKMKIFSGSAHPRLAQKIAQELKLHLGKVEIGRFPNGEKKVHILEKVENELVFIIQPTIKDEDIIEVCLLTDAVKNEGAKKIIAVIPWFGYSAQDKIFRSGEPLSSRVMAKILETSGVDKTIIVDPHSEKIKNFFSKPIILLSALKFFSNFLKRKIVKNTVVAALDKGDVKRSLEFAKELNLPLIILEKTPRNRQTGKIEFVDIKGNIVNKNVLFFDDFVSTGQTLMKAAKFLKNRGARKITACVTHYLSIKGLPEKLEKSLIDKIIVTDTLPFANKRKFEKLEIISVSSLLVKVIKKLL